MAGEYRMVLPKGLKRLGEDDLAKLVENKDIMLALTGSMVGNVTVRKDLKEIFIEALSMEFDPNLQQFADKYRSNLENDICVPVVSFNGQTSIGTDRYYRSGELFFST